MSKRKPLHRLDGPYAYGEWYINGYNVTDKIKEWAKERNINLDNLTDIDKAAIALEWRHYDEGGYKTIEFKKFKLKENFEDEISIRMNSKNDK